MSHYLSSTDEYRSLVKSTKKRYGRIRTNCQLLSSHFAPVIASRRLRCESCDDGLLMYVDEGDYENLYYYWNPQSPLAVEQKDKPTLLEELVPINGSKDLSDAYYTSAGFSFYRTNLHYEMQLANVQPRREGVDHAKEQGFELIRCESTDLQAKVCDLWRSNLELGDVPLEHMEFLERRNGGVVLIALLDSKVAGAYWWNDESRGTRSGRHVVTNPKYARRGIASALLEECAIDAAANGIRKISTWISESNTPSISLHTKIGFTATGRVAKQYLLNTSC